MQNKFLFGIYCFFLAFPASGTSLSIEETRVAFEQAAEDEIKNEVLLKNLGGPLTDPVLIAYRAATEALMGKFASTPWNKYSWCKQSMKTFRLAVRADSENIEIRYLRITIQSHLPSILNMSGDMEEDKRIILQNINKFTEIQQRKKIANYLIQHIVCTEAEKIILRKY